MRTHWHDIQKIPRGMSQNGPPTSGPCLKWSVALTSAMVEYHRSTSNHGINSGDHRHGAVLGAASPASHHECDTSRHVLAQFKWMYTIKD